MPDHEGATVPVVVVSSRTEAELIVGMLRNNDLDSRRVSRRCRRNRNQPCRCRGFACSWPPPMKPRPASSWPTANRPEPS